MIRAHQFGILIDAIYEAAAEFDRWPEVLNLIAKAFRAPAVVYGGANVDESERWNLAPQVDPAYVGRYLEHFHDVNPLWHPVPPALPLTVESDEMVLPRRAFERTEFFNDFLMPQGFGSMLSVIANSPQRKSIVTVQRRQTFDDEEVKTYARLAPHLARASRLNFHLAQLDVRCAAAAEGLDQVQKGVLFVDADARVLFANAEAERLMHPGGGLGVADGRLQARAPRDTARLRALVAACGKRGAEGGTGGCLSLERGPERSPLSLLVAPLRSQSALFFVLPRPVAIILAADPERRLVPSSVRLQARFGLTPAETALSVEIAKGDGVQACADRLKISVATARTHLARIFQKTETRRQAELVRLLMQIE